ncbi:MAG: hypothetical protein ACN6NV_07165 [Acinetobacter gandensis]|uniref:hypothetical protein n=1 Tax=Acinetobacter gandensis TaxID=1443941 RepID=UPI003D036418
MAGLVKHYQNTMKGIPQLSNNWGSMITLLDAVLITGFNYVPVLGLSKSSATAITATINLGSGHGFIDRQVVRIAGSTNNWDGDYKVLSADGASITVECTAQHPSVILGIATCFTAPADFEIVHQTPTGSLEPKRAYRSTDPESLGLILLVHDFCVSGAAATGAKFAKVGIVSDMSDIDTIISSQMPFNPVDSNANWGWDGTYHGWAKWYYRTAYYGASNTSLEDSSAALVGNSEFNIVTDGVSICVDTYTSNQLSYSIGGVFEFFDHSFVGKNIALLAYGLPNKVAQTQAIVNNGRTAITHQTESSIGYGSSNRNMRGLLWFDASGVENPTALHLPILLSPTNTLASAYSTIQPIFTDLILIDTNSAPRGVIPFLKMTTRSAAQNGVSEQGKYVNRYGFGLTSIATKHAILLERQ